ncbi:hypothetical protein PR048_007607 [Dryococelus australis]|uniref:Uncharacterized protein n=1 Tax=Dryococelus australis TaxID=614101 RepID=A0ABQ9HUQ0_9NEOP|nr:hypothetical protein PR048_007607 [Dryococelus australis]
MCVAESLKQLSISSEQQTATQSHVRVALPVIKLPKFSEEIKVAIDSSLVSPPFLFPSTPSSPSPFLAEAMLRCRICRLITSPTAAFTLSSAYPACVMECRLTLIQRGLIIALIMHGLALGVFGGAQLLLPLGCLHHWLNYSNLFTTLIGDNKDLSNVV